jgi:hypothetical protein
MLCTGFCKHKHIFVRKYFEVCFDPQYTYIHVSNLLTKYICTKKETFYLTKAGNCHLLISGNITQCINLVSLLDYDVFWTTVLYQVIKKESDVT